MVYRMMHEGLVPQPDYQMPPATADNISQIKEIAKLPPARATEFLQEVEKAIGWALAQKQMPLPHRSELLTAITQTAELAEQLANALRGLPPQAATFFEEAILHLSQQIRLAEQLEISCGMAANYAKTELGGAGETPDPGVRANLCFDIARALDKAGIKVTASRPKTGDNSGGAYWQISKICLQEAGLTVSDLYKHLRAGRTGLQNSR